MDSQPTKITAIEESRGEFLVSVSGLPEPLAMPVALIHQYHLKPGVVLTSAQVSQLVSESERYLCEREIARLLALREHSAGELRLKLKRKGFAERTIALLIEKFTAQRLLDDDRLAMNLARRALARKPAGRAFLVAVLRKKMIERSLAEHTVDLVLEEIDQTAAAVRALEQKWPNLNQIEVESVRSKAYSYLSRRGFDYQTARAACNEVFGTTGKAEED
jgi:regulatory protein